MERIRDLPPALIERERTEALTTLPTKLGVHYRAKWRRYAGAAVEPEDRRLEALFRGDGTVSVAEWLSAKEGSLTRAARREGLDAYASKQVFDRWAHRARVRGWQRRAPKLPAARKAFTRAVRDLLAGKDTPEFTR